MANKFWYHRLDGVICDVYTTARVDITSKTYVELITEYLTTEGRHIRTIGKYSVNGSVQFTGIPEAWGISMLYITNDTIAYENKGWGWTGTSSNSTSPTATGSWGIPTDNSPANSPRSPVCSYVVQSCTCN